METAEFLVLFSDGSPALNKQQYFTVGLSDEKNRSYVLAIFRDEEKAKKGDTKGRIIASRIMDIFKSIFGPNTGSLVKKIVALMSDSSKGKVEFL